MALKINPKNRGKIARKQLPNRIILMPDSSAGRDIDAATAHNQRIGEAEKWCVENLGQQAFYDRQTDTGYETFYTYNGRWVRLGQKFFFRNTTDATAFKLVWG